MHPKKLDAFITGIICGLFIRTVLPYIFGGIIIALVTLFSFLSPSSEAIPSYRGGFISGVDWSLDPARFHKPFDAGSNPAPAIHRGRHKLSEAPPTRQLDDLSKKHQGFVPELSPDGDGADVLSALSIIKQAAERNGIRYGSDDWFILLAIRRAENGGPGKEFGVKGKAWDTDLDTQAAWAAATVVKNRKRWVEAGRPGTFIEFLADRYCPRKDDPVGNINWKKNVKYWFNSLKSK